MTKKELKKELYHYIATQCSAISINTEHRLVYHYDQMEKVGEFIYNLEEKRIEELEKDKAYLDESLDKQIQATLDLQKEVKDLEWQLQEIAKDNDNYQKENAELKEQSDKWFVFETDAGNWGMDKATQYTVDRHNYFYGTKNECQIWAVEHKIKDYTGHKYCYDRLDDQLAQATKIIKGLLPCCRNYPQENAEKIKQAEQFLKEIEK